MKQFTKIEKFIASNSAELRSLFAVAVLRALTPMERQAVLNSIGAGQ